MFVPADHLVGDQGQGWAVANTTLSHERGTSFPFKEQVVHEGYLERLWQEAAAADRLDDVDVVDGLAQAFVELRLLRLHNWRTLSRLGQGLEPGPESSWVKLAWTDMTQHLSATALDVMGPAAPTVGTVAAPVAVVQGGVHRRRDLGDPTHHHRRADPRPASMIARGSDPSGPVACRRG